MEDNSSESGGEKSQEQHRRDGVETVHEADEEDYSEDEFEEVNNTVVAGVVA